MYPIVIIEYADKYGNRDNYKAFTVNKLGSYTPQQYYNIVYYHIGYQEICPSNNNIIYGKLQEVTYIKSCALTLEERAQGVQFVVKDDKSYDKHYRIRPNYIKPGNDFNTLHIHQEYRDLGIHPSNIRHAEHIMIYL